MAIEWFDTELQKEGTCCICGNQYKWGGCNPDPLGDPLVDRCCHECNRTKVQPARLRLWR